MQQVDLFHSVPAKCKAKSTASLGFCAVMERTGGQDRRLWVFMKTVGFRDGTVPGQGSLLEKMGLEQVAEGGRGFKLS